MGHHNANLNCNSDLCACRWQCGSPKRRRRLNRQFGDGSAYRSDQGRKGGLRGTRLVLLPSLRLLPHDCAKSVNRAAGGSLRNGQTGRMTPITPAWLPWHCHSVITLPCAPGMRWRLIFQCLPRHHASKNAVIDLRRFRNCVCFGFAGQCRCQLRRRQHIESHQTYGQRRRDDCRSGVVGRRLWRGDGSEAGSRSAGGAYPALSAIINANPPRHRPHFFLTGKRVAAS
jgi:hypothetical protein